MTMTMTPARDARTTHPPEEMMAAYIVSRIRISNREAMQRYMTEAPATVAAFGGHYLVRGGDVVALEGTWDHERMVVVEFPDREAARNWYESDFYRPLRDLRQANAEAVILHEHDRGPDQPPFSHQSP
jgi:uncharacterized protein (DUF1330 family)